VRNEEKNLPAKLDNLRQLDYPQSQVEIVVISDGSTDGTEQILRARSADVVAVILPEANGKAFALNAGVRVAKGEVLVFMDARQVIDSDALTELASCFADVNVGAVSGELLLEAPSEDVTGEGVGLYWKLEKAVRRLESATGSVVGVTGAIYALRRELFEEIPTGTLLDDVYVPMNVARRGKRVIFRPSAIARDKIFSAKGKEFSRKVRTLTGNYQLLRLQPWLLSSSNPLLFRFISHKLMRLAVPILLVILLFASFLADGAVYRTVFWLQVAFYVLAVVGSLSPAARRFKPVGVANTFVMLNTAAALAFYNFIRGRDQVWG
jgi:cellulose synthase/poly-beta-1,6-N-acetylglucosamine synthase-like glycosyltransferase